MTSLLLPADICSIIFQMDSTYLDYIRRHVLPFIHAYTIYCTKSIHTQKLLYLFHCRITNNVYMCDDLNTPTFISTHFSNPLDYLDLFKNKTRMYLESRKMEEIHNNFISE
jgi:hypothetical protein